MNTFAWLLLFVNTTVHHFNYLTVWQSSGRGWVRHMFGRRWGVLYVLSLIYILWLWLLDILDNRHNTKKWFSILGGSFHEKQTRRKFRDTAFSRSRLHPASHSAMLYYTLHALYTVQYITPKNHFSGLGAFHKLSNYQMGLFD